MKTIIKIITVALLLTTTSCIKISDYSPNLVDWELCYEMGDVEYKIGISAYEDAYYLLYKEMPYNILKVYISRDAKLPIIEYKTQREIKVLYFMRKHEHKVNNSSIKSSIE